MRQIVLDARGRGPRRTESGRAVCQRDFRCRLLPAALALASAASGAMWTAAAAQREGAEFVSIFDGRTLDGWHAAPADSISDWSVEDGVIVGQGSVDRLVYLVFDDVELTDFELKASYRFPDRGNSGIQIHAVKDPSGKRPFVGYHADLGHLGIGPHILGAWDFHFVNREEYACYRGTSLVIDPDGSIHTTDIEDGVRESDIRRHGWNEVRVVARGRQYQFFINGKLASEFIDNANEGRLDRGAIGLQIHDAGMRVEFKDLWLKKTASRK